MNYRNWFLNFFNRTYVLYLVAGLVLFFSLDHKVIIRRNLDIFQGSPLELIDLIKGKRKHDPTRVYYALRYYKNIVKIFPKSAPTYAAIGHCFYLLGDKNRAIRYFQKAISLDSTLLGFHYDLGIILWEKGLYDEAIESLIKAIHAPVVPTVNYFDVIFTSGKNQSVDQQNTVSTRQIQRVIIDAFQRIIARQEQLKDYDKMFSSAIQAIEILGKNEFFLCKAGQALYFQKEYSQATFFFKECLELNSEHPMALSLMSQALTELKELNAAKLFKMKYEKISQTSQELNSVPYDNYWIFYSPYYAVIINGKETIIR